MMQINSVWYVRVAGAAGMAGLGAASGSNPVVVFGTTLFLRIKLGCW
jgi:hypothetical protein